MLTWGWNRYSGRNQHRNLTLEKKNCPAAPAWDRTHGPPPSHQSSSLPLSYIPSLSTSLLPCRKLSSLYLVRLWQSQGQSYPSRCFFLVLFWGGIFSSATVFGTYKPDMATQGAELREKLWGCSQNLEKTVDFVWASGRQI